MSVLKSISGHTNLKKCFDYLMLGTGDVREYFEGIGSDRCIAKDFLNLFDHETDRWDSAMDSTRSQFGNAAARSGSRSRTYNHFIISPDPKDKVDLDTLRDLAMRWCREHFDFGGDIGPAQVAILYHDDNSERMAKGLPGIPHAHIVVNNTDLSTGKRIHISNEQNRNLASSLSRISEELGLAYFALDEFESDGKVVYRTVHRRPDDATGEGRKTRRDNRPSAQDVYRTMAERALMADGQKSWKDELRDMIDVAANLSSDIDGMRDALAKMGVSTAPRTGKRALPGELLFYYPNPGVELADNRKCVSGQRLGRKYTPSGLLDMMQLSYYQRLAADDRNEPRVLSLVSDINTVRIDPDSDIDLKDVSRAFAIITELKIQNMEQAAEYVAKFESDMQSQYADGAVRAKRSRQLGYLESLEKVSGVTDILPESPLNQRTREHGFKAISEQMRAQSSRKVSLEEKVDKGWRLTKSEHDLLKKTRPIDFARWQMNRHFASKGYTVDDSRIGSPSTRGRPDGNAKTHDDDISIAPPSQVR